MTNYSQHFPALVWLAFGALVIYSMAPFVARWLLWLGAFGVIIVGMVIANRRMDLTT